MKRKLQQVKDDAAPSPTVVQRVEQPFALKGPVPCSDKEAGDKKAVGGMRAPLEALRKLPHSDVGKRVRRGLVDYLTEHPQAMKDILNAVGKPKGTYDQSNEHVEAMRRRVGTIVGATSIDAVATETCTTPLRAAILPAWCGLAQDP